MVWFGYWICFWQTGDVICLQDTWDVGCWVSAHPYIFLARGTDGFLAARTPGGLDAVLAEMKAEAPKILALSRLQNVACREALTGWAASQYEKLPLSFAHNSVYLAMNSEASAMTAPTSGK